MTTTLYKHYDPAGTLLYVGVADNIHKRTKDHKLQSEWFDSVDYTMVRYYKTRADALQAEAESIRKDGPLYNKAKESYRLGVCTTEEGFEKALVLVGGVRGLARKLGCGSSLVAYWKRVRVPAERVHSICEAVNHEVAPADLRPDLFRDRAA